MVTVINYATRTNKEGKDFNALIIQGGVELIKSKSSGRFYASARTTSIPSTFDEKTCKMLVGQVIPGDIKKAPCDPYEYKIPGSDDIITLSHTYQYVPEEEKDLNVVDEFAVIH